MSHIIVFICGVFVGAVYQKSIMTWKMKAQRAAHAASEALKDN